MVGKALLVFVAVYCFAQAIRAETVDEVLAEYKPKIRQLSMKAGAAIVESAFEYGKAKGTTEWKKGQGKGAVALKLGLLKAFVVKAQGEAEAAGKDIEQCVKTVQEVASSINVTAIIGKCDALEELNFALENVQLLRSLTKEINRISEECVKEFPGENQTGDLRKCLDEALSNGDELVGQRKNAAIASSNAAVKKVNECVDAIVKANVTTIEKILEDFKKCVEQA